MIYLKAAFIYLQSTLNSIVGIGFIIITIVFLFTGGQEIFALRDGHDSYYFIWRSTSFDFRGSYLASIKEYPYSLFVWISQIYGISLRNFEVLCYGLALLWLWHQTVQMTKSHLVGWITVIPLTLFPYQHPVFNRATYDALQLILTPLTFGSALQIVSKRASHGSLITSGLIAGCHVITRPEGFLFVLPPLISLFFITAHPSESRTRVRSLKFLQRATLICLAPIALQHGISAINQVKFGFWAPTIIKSAEFQAGLSSLMSIRPIDNTKHNYAPFPKSAMQQAYDASPTFLRAKPFFDQNLDGNGWSKHADPRYRAADGSISGGHFQWALLDASASVAGPQPRAMLAYLKAVSDEIQGAFDRGQLLKRNVISTALGPDFSILNRPFWLSVSKIGTTLFGFGTPTLPQLADVTSIPQVESDFNRLALRRTALLQDKGWQVSGWVLAKDLGLPQRITLDQEAQIGGINLKLIKRADVAKAILGLDVEHAPLPLCGFELSSTELRSGNLIVEYPGQMYMIPIKKLVSIESGNAYDYENIHVHLDIGSSSKPAPNLTHFKIVKWLTSTAHYTMRFLIIFTMAFLAAFFVFKNKLIPNPEDQITLILVAMLAFSIIVPKLGLLAAIDSAMYPGTEPRYLSAAAFSIWFFAAFTAAMHLQSVRIRVFEH